MRTLFWKIFAWFGAAQLLITVAPLYLLASATQRGFNQGLTSAVSSDLESRANIAAAIYEANGKDAVKKAWRSNFRRFGHQGPPPGDDDGFDPSQRAPGGPPDFNDGPPPSDGDDDGGPGRHRIASFYVWKNGVPVLLAGPSVPVGIKSSVAGAFATGEARYDAEGDDGLSFIARRVRSTKGNRYVAVEQLYFPSRTGDRLNSLLRLDPVTLARYGIAGLLMMCLCFGLARYLSAPARKLREATHQFAEGDLATRVGPQMGRRRDELADLGRDFDAMAERIEELVNAQQRLLGDISHELRTPLARLNVAVELAADTAQGETCNYLDRIKEESAELDSLIGQLLTLQRLESNTTVLKMPLDLAGLVSHIAEDVDFEARARGTRVEVRQLDECQVEGNVELLKSAVQNITRNAVLHAGGSHVQVGVERVGDLALVSVRDFGAGVPEESLERLFDPFYRVDNDRDRKSGGTGLGMSITKRAVEAHGGSVRAQNAHGGGLLVQIMLPLDSSSSSESTPHPAILQSAA